MKKGQKLFQRRNFCLSVCPILTNSRYKIAGYKKGFLIVKARYTIERNLSTWNPEVALQVGKEYCTVCRLRKSTRYWLFTFFWYSGAANFIILHYDYWPVLRYIFLLKINEFECNVPRDETREIWKTKTINNLLNCYPIVINFLEVDRISITCFSKRLIVLNYNFELSSVHYWINKLTQLHFEYEYPKYPRTAAANGKGKYANGLTWSLYL